MLRRQPNVESFAVNRSGTALLDEIRVGISSSRIIGDGASPEGLSHALLHGREGFEIDAIGTYEPGIDDIANFDANETLGTGEARARKVLSTGEPSTVHVILDVPERTEKLEGNHSAEYIGNLAIAVSTRVAEVMGDTYLSVYHSKAPRSLLFEGDPNDAEQIFRNKKRLDPTIEDKSLTELVSAGARNIVDDVDATVLVSDFMDGYDVEADKFDWEDALKRLAGRQEDLLRVARISSVSHTRAPYDLIKGMNGTTLEVINAQYAEQAAAKEARIQRIFKDVLSKSVTINTDEPNPARSIINLIVGREVN